MKRVLLTVVALALVSSSTWAEGYAYQARMEGMVCAFCAYNASKTIGALPGVDPESVNVDLESQLVNFYAESLVDRESVSAAFSDTGFTLSKLEVVEHPPSRNTPQEDAPAVVLNLDGVDAGRFAAVLEALGAIASTQGMRLVIEAPETAENDLLIPLLMGRRPALNVRFVAIQENSVHLKMFLVPRGT